MKEIIKKEEFYKIIGLCMEVHKILGKGFLEIVYKDALEFEFKKNKIPYEREKEFKIEYKTIILPHKFFADFVVYDNIILEVKAVNGLVEDIVKLVLNYMAAAKARLGILTNFGSSSLQFKNVVL